MPASVTAAPKTSPYERPKDHDVCLSDRRFGYRLHAVKDALAATFPILTASRFQRDSFYVPLIYEITQEQREAVVGELMGLLREATLKHSIGLRLALREAASAHDRIEQGSVVGNVVLDIH